MRRLFWFLAIAGCRQTAPLTPCPSTPIVVAPTASASASASVAPPPPQVPSCPEKLVEAKPSVVRYASLAEAAKKLKTTLPNHTTDLKAAAKERGDAFFFEVPFGYYHESSTLRSDVAAVMVVAPAVIAMPGLFELAHPMPGPCGNGHQSEGLGLAVVGGVAHVRVLRAGVNDVPTLPPEKYTGDESGCGTTQTYRIEDHFVDVKSGEHLLALGQSFVGPAYGALHEPGVPFEVFKVIEASADTSPHLEAGECTWFWND